MGLEKDKLFDIWYVRFYWNGKNVVSNSTTPLNEIAFEPGVKILFRKVRKAFQTEDGSTLEVLRGLSASIREKEFVVLCGPSGCGKTTLLNIAAGLLALTSGYVVMDGKEVTSPGRERGMVFQQDAILMWRKVLANVEYGLELRNIPKRERRRIGMEYLRMVGLEEFANFFPKELSGGMRKRVQIAAVFANNPEVLLMDEPFGSLDYPTKVSMQQQLVGKKQSKD